MTIPIGVQNERDSALIDAQAVINEYGDDIIFYNRAEANITRDQYYSITRRAVPDSVKITLKSYPLTFQPNRNQLEQAGLREDCELIAKIAMKDLTDNGLTFESIDMTRGTFEIRDIKYLIKEKTLDSQFADTFLYVHVGLARI